MNTTITEMQNTLEGNKSRITQAEKRINDREERMVGTAAVQWNEKKKKK